jgi:DNA-binding phage protein
MAKKKRVPATKTTQFDAANYLDSEARQVTDITAALETGDADFVRDVFGLVAHAARNDVKK